MPAFHARQYAGNEDRARLRAFLVNFRAAQGHGCWHIGDLTWRFFLQSFEFTLEDTLRLWEDEQGNLAGYCIYYHRGNPARLLIDLQLHPHARGKGLEAEMLAWCASRLPGGRGTLVTDPGVYEDDRSQIEQLERHGFQYNPDGDAYLLCYPLDKPLPAPVLPDGFQVRGLSGLPEAESRAEVHRLAFESRRVTGERYRLLMQAPDYHPELDTVAVSPRGELAAFALGWYDDVNHTGEFEPVGTHPNFRRKGLAHAVLLSGMAALQKRGAEQVVIGPIAVEDQPALQTYRSLGFQPILKSMIYTCSIEN